MRFGRFGRIILSEYCSPAEIFRTVCAKARLTIAGAVRVFIGYLRVARRSELFVSYTYIITRRAGHITCA